METHVYFINMYQISIQDIEYLRGKHMTNKEVPKYYLGIVAKATMS